VLYMLTRRAGEALDARSYPEPVDEDGAGQGGASPTATRTSAEVARDDRLHEARPAR
jgi:hypothetical protein